MKTDKSTKVGGRRKKGPAAPKSSVAKKPRGKPVMMPGGQKAYQKR
jgi:hypothetical protein